jgi:hypothetical protein
MFQPDFNNGNLIRLIRAYIPMDTAYQGGYYLASDESPVDLA